MSTVTEVKATVQSPDTIKALLEKSSKAIERGILAIYERQTADEKATESTNHENGVGFSGADAEILSSFASQIMRKESRGVALGQCLSEKQIVIARKKMLKYARQLAEIANEKSGVSPEEVKAFMKAERKAKAQASLEAMSDPEPVVAEEAPVAPKAPVAYWLLTPGNGWRELTKAQAQNWSNALVYNVKRMGHEGKVGIKAFEALQDGDFQINYAGELLQVMEPGITPDSEAWAEKVTIRELKRIGMTEEMIEAKLISMRAKRQAEREAKAAESLRIEREMWEAEAEGDKAEAEGDKAKAEKEALEGAKNKITAWLSK